jgi:hypothetical protein
MVSPVVALLVGVLCTLAIIVYLANIIPVPADSSCTAGTGTGAAGATTPAAATTTVPPPPPPAAPAAAPGPAATGTAPGPTSLTSGNSLNDGQSIYSPDGSTQFTFQYGIISITKNKTQQLFASPNAPVTNGVVKLGTDGTIGIYASLYSVTPIWSTGAKSGQGPFTLSPQNDGNVLMFDSTPTVVWSAPITTASSTASVGTYTPANMWVGNTGNPIATGTLNDCQMACTIDSTCGGFSRQINVQDTDQSPCYKFSSSLWTTPGSQQQSSVWKSYVKSQ